MRPDKTNVWPTDWRVFLTKLAWGLAVLLLASGLVTWVAAHWDDWGNGAKFALAQGAVLVSAGLAWLFRRRAGGWGHDLGVPAALTGLAAVATGGLLALIGQTYQTGADPWQLFALWTVLIIPWVLAVRSVFLSVLFVVLLNTALYLWIDVARLDWFGRGARHRPCWRWQLTRFYCWQPRRSGVPDVIRGVSCRESLALPWVFSWACRFWRVISCWD